MTASEKNALAVTRYIDFLVEIFRQRFKHSFDIGNHLRKRLDVKKIVLIKDDCELSTFIFSHQ